MYISMPNSSMGKPFLFFFGGVGIELRALYILGKFSATGHISSMAKDGTLSVFPLACPHLRQAHTHRLTSPFTRVCLSVGDDRASTRSLGQILSSFSCSTCQYQKHLNQSHSEPLLSEVLALHILPAFKSAGTS